MPEQVTRDFKIADDLMIQDARTKHGAYVEDLTDFTAFDPDFDAAYGNDFETAINDAEAMEDDETITDQQTELTNVLLERMKECRNKFQDSKFFIEKAFPDNLAVQNEFGFNDYKQAIKVQASFIKFMLKFHAVATKYKVLLIAQNYTQLMIDDILTCYEKLRDADIAQELFIKNRPVKTQDRLIAMNAAWAIERTICEAGKRIYKDDYAKYQRYLLPPGEETPEAVSITGTVTNSAGGAPEEGVEVVIEALAISVLTNAAGLYAIGGLPAGTYSLAFNKATLQEKKVDNVVVVDGVPTVLNVAMEPG